MKRLLTPQKLLFTSLSFLMIVVASCHKDSSNSAVTPATATPKNVGLIETDSSIYKLLLINVGVVGTQTINDDMVFDTGSGGMVLDAQGVIPSSMVTKNGFVFTGDSTVVDGITITSDTSSVVYGDDDASTAVVHGNLAYASVTVDEGNGNVVIKRLPFFLYYIAEQNGEALEPHEFDVFGVNSEYDFTFNNGVSLQSPFSYYAPGTGLTKGFKMAAVNESSFTLDGNYVSNVIQLGLTAADLSSSSGFNFTTLSSYPGEGYLPYIPATVAYGIQSFSTYVLFDTGTEPYNYLENPNASDGTTLLPVGTAVKVTSTSGFNYSYTVSSTDNLTYVENPKQSGVDITILGLEFFLTNDYMLDYTDHKLGVKND